MLDDPEREVKKQVIQSLGEVKDPQAIPALQEIASNRVDRELHMLAKDAIAKMN
jgi:HEAT repeat protein